MIYFQEILFRFFYLFLTSLSVFLILFLFKEYVLLLLFDSLFFVRDGLKDIGFLFNSPYDLFETYWGICVNGTFLILTPFFLYQLQKYFSQALSFNENLNFKKSLLLFTFWFYLCNVGFIFFVLPNIWVWLEYFNTEILYYTFLNVEYEPTLQRYISFISVSLLWLNFFLLGLFCHFLLFKNKLLLESLHLNRYHKLFLLSFCLFCFFTQPDPIQGVLTVTFCVFFFFLYFKFLIFLLSLKYLKTKYIY